MGSVFGMHQRQHGGLVHGQEEPEDPSAHPGLASLFDLAAELLKSLNDALLAWIAEAMDTAPLHILDLGSGSGAGACALLERFPDRG